MLSTQIEEQKATVSSLEGQIRKLESKSVDLKSQHDAEVSSYKKEIADLYSVTQQQAGANQSLQSDLEKEKAHVVHLERELVVKAEHNDEEHHVDFTHRLHDHHLDSFGEDQQKEYIAHVAQEIGVPASQVRITKLSAGSVVVETKVVGLKSSTHAQKVKDHVNSDALQSSLASKFGAASLHKPAEKALVSSKHDKFAAKVSALEKELAENQQRQKDSEEELGRAQAELESVRKELEASQSAHEATRDEKVID